MVAKTAATTEDEAKAREVWRLHEKGVKPALIANDLGLSRQLVRDILNGRRLAPAISERSAANTRRCPHCGKLVLSLPCLACELNMERKKPMPVVQKPKVRVTQVVARRQPPKTLQNHVFDEVNRSLVCNECGERRMMAVSGLVCPNGHGRIHRPVDSKTLKTYEYTKMLRSLPIGVRTDHGKATVRVAGIGLCTKVPKRCQNDAIQVNVEGHVWLVSKIES